MEEPESTWTFIPAADFTVPIPPATDAARGTLRRTWQLLYSAMRRSNPQASSTSTDWDCPANSLLQTVSPTPDWMHVADAFTAAIGRTWFDLASSTHPIHTVIGPPGCDLSKMLLRLAQQHQLRTLTAPAPESLLEPLTDDLFCADTEDVSEQEILVVPQLERWYLRHEDGLHRLRALLEHLTSTRSRVLIGCDSWAWAFLQHAVGIEDRIGSPLTLSPLDAKRLTHWFRRTLPLDQYEFMHPGNNPVFPTRDDTKQGNGCDKDPQTNETSDFFTSLSVKSRGNPGVAQAIWNTLLRTRNAKNDMSPSTSHPEKTSLWVVSPDELATPQLPLNNDRVHRFIVHAILLHGGLSRRSLATVLPFSPDEIHRRVSELCRAHILVEQNDELQVNLIAYPIVRRELQSEGFLTDVVLIFPGWLSIRKSPSCLTPNPRNKKR
ncbi:hypothetical protein RMSM_00120 [Rhodopirellula maiorica SM1]|uniref:Uncharacterized protein n=1 Tax=Rhodopirellula maiorica SM1 TaxID=1265738 RepID=M5RUD4_9BACT|nr:hypothetical protein [Rhodopirellula maiorica]EMI22953.1 hypothetical protein RMSM_00120 [Rhodopirellula maiorica SM1]